MDQDTMYAGFWARLIAWILDYAIVLLILVGIGIATATAITDVAMLEIATSVLTVLVPLLYWPALESSSRQATLGKRIMGLRVTGLDGNRLSFSRAFLRHLAKMLSSITLGIGFLMAAFTARKQALHDFIPGSLVVRASPFRLWKLFLALVIGLALLLGSAGGAFYYAASSMWTKGLDDVMKSVVPGLPPITSNSARAPARKTPASNSRPVRAKVSTPSRPGAKKRPDAAFDAAVGGSLIGLEKPGTTRAGPAILELSTFFTTGNPSVWVKVHMPPPPFAHPTLLPAPKVTVNRVLSTAGRNHYDMGNTFEKAAFRHVDLSLRQTPIPHMTGIRSVHLKPSLTAQTLRSIQGMVTYRAAVEPKTVRLDAQQLGQQVTVHDTIIALQSVSGNTARIRFRGASEHLLGTRGQGADGKPLRRSSWQQLPLNQDVDKVFWVTFVDAPATVEVAVASRIIERFFSFSLEPGATAGAPDPDQGYTMPQRVRKALPPLATTSTLPKKTPAPKVTPIPAADAAKPAKKSAVTPISPPVATTSVARASGSLSKADPKAPPRTETKPVSTSKTEPKGEPKAPPITKPKAASPRQAENTPEPQTPPTGRSSLHSDPRSCLALPTKLEIIRCAEKFR